MKRYNLACGISFFGEFSRCLVTMFENHGDLTDFEVNTTVSQEYEKIKSSKIEVSEGMGALDIKRNLDFH